MASQNSTLRAAQVAADTTRNADTTIKSYQAPIRYAIFDITLTTAVASNDDIILGKLGCAGTVIPELSRAVGISGGAAGSFTLEKVNAAGTVAALTGAAAITTDGTSVAFARKSGFALGTFDEADYLQVTFTEASGGAINATDVLQFMVAYIAPDLP
jgi:hypothetical protein